MPQKRHLNEIFHSRCDFQVFRGLPHALWQFEAVILMHKIKLMGETLGGSLQALSILRWTWFFISPKTLFLGWTERHKEREREKEKEREREREGGRGREGERERGGGRGREREGEREGEGGRQEGREREREEGRGKGGRERERERERRGEGGREGETERKKEKERRGTEQTGKQTDRDRQSMYLLLHLGDLLMLLQKTLPVFSGQFLRLEHAVYLCLNTHRHTSHQWEWQHFANMNIS